VLRVVAAFDNQFNLKNPKKGKGKALPAHASLSMDMFYEITAALKPSDFVQSVVANVLKRKLKAVDDEHGDGRGAKRRSSTLSESGEKVESEDEKGEAQTDLASNSSRVTTRGQRKKALEALEAKKEEDEEKGPEEEEEVEEGPKPKSKPRSKPKSKPKSSK
jgi:hypothetical protein